MGDLSDSISGCLKVILIAIAIIIAGLITASYYSGKSEGEKKYEQGIKDAMSGKIDSTFIKNEK